MGAVSIVPQVPASLCGVSLSGCSCRGRLLHAHTGADSPRAERAPRTPGEVLGCRDPSPCPSWRFWFIDLFRSLRLDTSSSLRVSTFSLF